MLLATASYTWAMECFCSFALAARTTRTLAARTLALRTALALLFRAMAMILFLSTVPMAMTMPVLVAT